MDWCIVIKQVYRAVGGRADKKDVCIFKSKQASTTNTQIESR